MYECFHCLSRSVTWDADFSFEDYLMEGEGIVHHCHCNNCGAEIEYFVPVEEGRDKMNLRPVEAEEFERIISKKRSTKGKLQAIIEEFMRMDCGCVEVTGYDHKTPQSASSALSFACKRMNVSAKARLQNGKVYLYKTIPHEQQAER